MENDLNRIVTEYRAPPPFFLLGQAAELIRDHSCYLALGATDEPRQAAYRALFRHQVDDTSLKAIREAVNSGTALGSERFKDEIEATLARSVRLGPPGRPRKKEGDEGMSKQCGLGLRGK